jgi:DNA-binding NtrC family response regulator
MRGYGLRVLVADDCDEDRLMLAKLLAWADYNVHVAFEGAGALREMNTRRFDVVITSDELAGLDSLDLVRLGRIMCPQTPIVVMACPDSESAELALQRGAYAWIRKPYDSAVVLQILDSATRLAGKERASKPMNNASP